MGNSRTQLFSGLGIGIGVDIGTVAACLPFCLGGAHNLSCPVNWLVGCCVVWLDGCSTAWLTAWLVGWAATQSLAIWRCIVFPLLVFVTLIAIRCSLAALGGKLIAFAAEFLFSFLVFYYLKFMSVFSIESRDGQSREYIAWSRHAVFMLVDPLAVPTLGRKRKRKLQSNCSVYCVLCSCRRRLLFPLFLFSLLFCDSFCFPTLTANPNSSEATSVFPLVAYITFN